MHRRMEGTDEFSGSVAGGADPAVVTLAPGVSPGSAGKLGQPGREPGARLALGAGGAVAAVAGGSAAVAGTGSGLRLLHLAVARGAAAVLRGSAGSAAQHDRRVRRGLATGCSGSGRAGG